MLIPRSDNPRCEGLNGWLLHAVIETTTNPGSDTPTIKTIEKSILGSPYKNKPITLQNLVLADNQKLVSHEIVFCGCEPGLLGFKNGCADPRLSQITSTCQRYDNRVTIGSYVYDPKDDDEIARLREIIKAGEPCTYYPPTTTNTTLGNWVCQTQEASNAMSMIVYLRKGEWVYTEDIQIPNPSYNPDWLAVNKRIFRLTESLNKNSKFSHGSRTIVEKLNGEVVNVYYWPSNFITKIDWIFCGEGGQGVEYCRYKEVDYKCWLAVIEYECSNVSAAGEFDSEGGSGVDPSRQKKPKCGKCEIKSGGKKTDSPNNNNNGGSGSGSPIPPRPNNSNGSGSGSDGDGGGTPDDSGCCTDMRLLIEFFNAMGVPASEKSPS